MKKSTYLKLIAILVLVAAGSVAAQDSATSPTPSSAGAGDIETLRDQVKALTETVKALQKQVQDQNAVLQKANIVAAPELPQNPVTSPTPGSARKRRQLRRL